MESPSHLPSSPRRGKAFETALLGVVLVLAAFFYVWTATSALDRWSFKLQPHDLYNRLADGFLAGQLSFVERPAPELAELADPYDPAQNAPFRRFHDVSYRNGRYYLYFGPAPAVVLLAPWKALTGSYLPQHIATAVFGWGTAALGVVLVCALRRRYFPATPSWVVVAAAIAVAFGSLIPVLLRRPVYYELAIACGSFFTLLALVFIERAARRTVRTEWWLAGSSLALGLAVASRPHFVLTAAAVLGWHLAPRIRAAWRAGLRDDVLGWGRLLGAGLGPIGFIGLCLMTYNVARFGSITEFGTHFQLAGGNQQTASMFAAGFARANLWFYLLAPAQLSIYFPFVQVTPFAPFVFPAGYTGQENMYGSLVTLPVLWMALGLLRLRRVVDDEARVALRHFLVCAGLVVVINQGFLLLLSGANNRYFVDFVPVMMVVAVAGIMAWEGSVGGRLRRAGRMVWLGALAVTVLFNVFVSLQHNDLLRYHNPETYGKLARAFNHLSQWMGGDGATRHGPLRIRLQFPAGRTGQLEPLVVTGLSFRADFLYVYYQDDRSVVLGFEHTSYGGPKTPPLPIDYAAEHVLELDMGALYPPAEHPWFDGLTPEEVSARKRRFRLTLNGAEVLAGEYETYDASPGDIAVGHNPVSDAFGRKFTGRIVAVERLPAER